MSSPLRTKSNGTKIFQIQLKLTKLQTSPGGVIKDKTLITSLSVYHYVVFRLAPLGEYHKFLTISREEGAWEAP